MSTTSTSPTRRSSASVRPEDMALRDYMVVLAAALVSSAVGAAEPAAKLSPVMSGTVHQALRSEEHTSELQSLMRISYAVFCLKKKNKKNTQTNNKTE